MHLTPRPSCEQRYNGACASAPVPVNACYIAFVSFTSRSCWKAYTHRNSPRQRLHILLDYICNKSLPEGGCAPQERLWKRTAARAFAHAAAAAAKKGGLKPTPLGDAMRAEAARASAQVGHTHVGGRLMPRSCTACQSSLSVPGFWYSSA